MEWSNLVVAPPLTLENFRRAIEDVSAFIAEIDAMRERLVSNARDVLRDDRRETPDD